MTDLSVRLSAWLDGELPDKEAQQIEALLEHDADLQAELERLMAANEAAIQTFDAVLSEPVPMNLARAIRDMPVGIEESPIETGWGWPARIAAALAFVAIGAGGGFLASTQLTPPTIVAERGWLDDIADYHEVYAQQVRHLVEVPASESDHLKTWLGNTIGTEFAIPNLEGYGLTFEGGRLLVAGGEPVAQLMYRREDGEVIALCFQAAETEPSDAIAFNESTRRGFDFVSWRNNGARYVVIGPGGTQDLGAIAETAALEI
ncbi:MAG: anti-sigma factor [Pseudomonadota bacterium]